MIFDRVAKTIQEGKARLLNEWFWATGPCKRNEAGPLSYTRYRISSKQIKDLHERAETTKSVEQKHGAEASQH